MNISEIYPSKYLRGADLGGRAALVRITSIQLESFYDSEHKADVKKPVLFFDGKQKGLILSKTLAYKIAEILGSEFTDDWKGQTIVIYAERRLVFGHEKDVLMARAPAESE